MKKLKYLLFALIITIFSMSKIYAESNVELKSIELDSKSENTVINDEVSFENLNINIDISFLKTGDFVKYKFVLKNNSSYDYDIINNSTSSIDNISYKVDIDNEINSNEEITGYITITYKDLLNSSSYTGGVYEFDDILNIPLELKESNPKTMDNIIVYVIMFTCSLILLVLLLKYRSLKKCVVPIMLLCIFGIYYHVSAFESIKTIVNLKVSIYEDENNDSIADTKQYASIVFNAGEHGTINGESSYTTDRIYLSGYSKYPESPEVVSDDDYKFKEWTPNYVVGDKLDSSNPVLTFTATYYEDKNNNNIDDSTELVSITFDAGEHGTINGKTTYTTDKIYLSGYSKYPELPEVVSDDDYKFKEWTPNYVVGDKLDSSNPVLTFTATYYEDKNNNNIDDSTELVSITFDAGEHGTINGKTTYTTDKIYLPGYSKYPVAPNVTINEGDKYIFDEFTDYDENTVIPLKSGTITFNATYYYTFETGTSIKLGSNQDFYVISSNKNTTLLFAAYNLNVGSYQNSKVKTGIQDPTIRAWVSKDADNFGNTSYYDKQGDTTSGTSKLDGYLNDYKSYLESNFIKVNKIDLLSRSTAVSVLGMGTSSKAFDSSSPYYSWMTYTTFWFKEEANMDGYIYYCNTSSYLGKANDVSGIRPTIEVNTSDLYKYMSDKYDFDDSKLDINYNELNENLD